MKGSEKSRVDSIRRKPSKLNCFNLSVGVCMGRNGYFSSGRQTWLLQELKLACWALLREPGQAVSTPAMWLARRRGYLGHSEDVLGVHSTARSSAAPGEKAHGPLGEQAILASPGWNDVVLGLWKSFGQFVTKGLLKALPRAAETALNLSILQCGHTQLWFLSKPETVEPAEILLYSDFWQIEKSLQIRVASCSSEEEHVIHEVMTNIKQNQC